MNHNNNLELTILMPCLNEAETLATCIKKARKSLEDNQIAGEILIADNGSTDGSQQIAIDNGARVIDVKERGYGAALIAGSQAACGKYTIMGDADDSYDFSNLMPFVERLRSGDELVMGNRFKGGIEKGAMPPLHQYFGNPALTLIGKILFFPCKINDFNCGLRGYNTEAIRKLNLRTTGMEYASEMVVKANLYHLKISEIPTKLRPDGRSRAPHLRSWRDGWRNLKFMLMHSPNWLFLYPGIILFVLGFILSLILIITPVTIGSISFSVNTLVFFILMTIVGVNAILFAIFTKVYAVTSHFIPSDKKTEFLCDFSANKGSTFGVILIIIGVIASITSLILWKNANFGAMIHENLMRLTLPALGAIVIGVQLIFGGFLVDILRIKAHKD